MTQVTVGSKYQVVIPLSVRKKVGNLLAGRKVTLFPLDESHVMLTVLPENSSEKYYGCLRNEYSQNVLQKIQEIRDEWGE